MKLTYYQRNKAKVQAYMLAYRRSHRLELNALERARRRANPEKNREQCRRYAQSHRKQVVARVRRWQLKQDPEAFRALQRRYYANAKARRLQAAAVVTPAAL
jgi:hypothetical protein